MKMGVKGRKNLKNEKLKKILLKVCFGMAIMSEKNS
jgi:hypothetical protein